MRSRLLTVAVMAALCATGTVIAAPAGSANGCIAPAAGTAGDPYLISTAANLTCLMGNSSYWAVGKYFRQTADITLTGASTPIGTAISPFKGNYDGRGFTISDLSINQPSGDYIGLFGFMQGASLTGIRVSGSVTARTAVGGLVGYAEGNSTIHDCRSSVSVTTDPAAGQNDYLGGLVGLLNTGTITSSSATGSVTWAGSVLSGSVGGLVGQTSDAAITESWSSGSVRGRTSVGGLVGELFTSVVRRSYATGSVSGVGGVGGLVGKLYGLNPAIDMIVDSYARGSVTINAPSDAYKAGSLVGWTELSSEAVTTSYGTGAVTGTGPKGGIVGATPASWSASFWDIDTTGIATAQASGSVPGVTGRTTSQMTQISTFQSAGWSISNVSGSGATWGICPSINDGYPFLQAFYPSHPCSTSADLPPPPWHQSYARGVDETCLTGWSPSWASWPNGGTGGFVCNRTFVYNMSTSTWEIRSRRVPALRR